jgi:Protein of unknown function, DUF481
LSRELKKRLTPLSSRPGGVISQIKETGRRFGLPESPNRAHHAGKPIRQVEMQSFSVRHPPFSRCAGLALLLLVLTSICSARDRTDVIQFTNGDRITCEIIRLEKGYLYVRLPYAQGEIGLDWSKVARVESPQSFVVADKSGQRYTGTLQSVPGGSSPDEAAELKVQVAGSSSRQLIPGKEVVELEQTDTNFWQNLHGDLSAGLNYAKQQNRTQYNFESNTIFQRTKWSMAESYQASFSGGGNISDLRNDLRLNVARQLFSPRNFYQGLADFLQSNEQQLDLRTTVGGAVGHLFSFTNSSIVAAVGGVVWNRERYSSEATMGRTGDSAEALLGTQVNFFRFKTTNVLADVRFYPSLTDPGRVRLDLNTSLKLRVAKRLDWNFGYYLNFDSRPPQNLPRTDYGATSGLGWRF